MIRLAAIAAVPIAFEVPELSESSGAVAIMALRSVTEFVTIEVTVEHPQW